MSREKLLKLARKINRDHGDALVGEKIIAQARSIGHIFVVPGSSSHRIQEVALKENAFCVIDRPFHLREGKMKLKK